MNDDRHDRGYAGPETRDPGVVDAPGSYCIQCSAAVQDWVPYPCEAAR